MTILSAWLRQRRTAASVTALAILAGVPLGFAVLHQGFPVTEVQLSSNEVWVTNGKELLAGRLNTQIEELTAAVNASSTDFTVFQNGDDVFLYDDALGTLDRVDPAFTELVQRIDVPPGSEVAYGGDTLAILSTKGELWITDAAGELSFDPHDAEPAASLGAGARVAVSENGVVLAVSLKHDQLFTFTDQMAEPQKNGLEGLTEGFQLSAVGDQAVILDAESNSFRVGTGQPRELPDEGLRLQQSGEANDFAVVATASGLLELPLGGGDATVIDADVTAGTGVAAPVFLNGCVHGAWADAQRYLASCEGSETVLQNIEQNTRGSKLEFRVNRDTIALNNLNNGNVWLLDSTMRLVNNWEEVTPPDDLETEEGDEKSSTQSFEDTLAERTEQNRVPIARDDSFGVRPGKTTVLPVLENDTDPDGDVLTVVNHSSVSEAIGRLEYIDGGRALQFTPGENAAGTVSFRYTVSDGAGGVAEASVNLAVHPLTQNEAPVQNRVGTVSVEQGQSIGYNLLTDWIDPDGDDLFLVSASPTSADTVRFGPDGYMTFQHKSGELGPKTVEFVVSDGVNPTSGTLSVNVESAGKLGPIGTPDFAETFVGETVAVQPLQNDVSPSGQPLTLIGTNEVPKGLSAVASLERGTISVSASQPGSYIFMYGLGAGPTTSIGLIRVDVKEKPGDPLPPIAVKDVAYLRAGEPLTLNVLSNDVSPNGSVLAVQSVNTEAAEGLIDVEVLTNTALRFTSSEALTEQVQLEYTVSDGFQTSTAGITVVPVPPLVKHQPPVATNDSVAVRAGDIVTVPVLNNDYHPDSATMTLNPELVEATNIGTDAVAFVTGDTVRYQAPKEPGVYSVVYEVVDGFAESARATVTFTVNGPDAEGNQAPVPLPLVSRTFEGSTVKIEVPLDGIDPNGDYTVLDDVSVAPTMGRIIASGTTFFTYEAYPGSQGTDTFSYTVVDGYGAVGTGTISIGVIPRAETLLPPNAIDDAIEIKPGRTASVPVLLNDSDPNGFPTSLDKLLEVDSNLEAEIDKSRVVVTAPDVEGGYAIRYQMSNGQGGVDSAFIQVKVTNDAKIKHPTAHDQVIEPDQLRGKSAVDVDVLHDAQNPGGLLSDLVITLDGPNASAAEVLSDGTISVKPRSTRMAITYRLTNTIDELDAEAFIIVPALRDASEEEKPAEDPPFLSAGEQQIRKNETKSWNVGDIVTVPTGRPAVVTSALASNGTVVFDKGSFTFTPTNDYRGPASVTFGVTDGSSASDPKGNQAQLTLIINVGDPNMEDEPPTFTPRSEVVEAGEGDTSIELRDSSGHPNPALISQLTYTGLSGATSEVVASLSGSTLTFSSPLGTQPGATARLSFTVGFKEFSVPGYIDVQVVSSTRPQPEAVEDSYPEARPSQTVTVDVLANDFNPFGDKEPLRVIDANADSSMPNGGATVSFTSNDVTVRTGAGWTGTFTVIYRVQDATKDPAREKQGYLFVTVKDRPDRPVAPVATAGDGTVSVTFQAPSSNNDPITGYTVYFSGGTKADCSPGIACAIPWTNGTPFSATVSATNGVGEGRQSTPSNTVTPYGTPSPPRSPSIAQPGYANATLYLSWAAPTQTGGGTIEYKWRLNGGAWNTTTSTNANVSGKPAGTYNFEVIATNTGNKSSTTVTSNTVTVVNEPPPPASARICKGGGQGSGYGVVVQYYNFSGSNHSFITTIDGSTGQFTYNYESVSGTNKYTLQNWINVASAGSQIRVEITGESGVGSTNTISGATWNGLAPGSCS